MNPEVFNSNSFGPSKVPNIFSTQTDAFERIPTLEDYLEKDKPRMEYGSSRMKVRKNFMLDRGQFLTRYEICSNLIRCLCISAVKSDYALTTCVANHCQSYARVVTFVADLPATHHRMKHFQTLSILTSHHVPKILYRCLRAPWQTERCALWTYAS